jgi:hypothetical protein
VNAVEGAGVVGLAVEVGVGDRGLGVVVGSLVGLSEDGFEVAEADGWVGVEDNGGLINGKVRPRQASPRKRMKIIIKNRRMHIL